MNRTLFTLLFSILAATTFAADRPKGFLGINWGASPEEAKRIMQARPGVKFPEETDDYKFALTGGTFAGQPVERWVLEFPERKFASAVVVLKTEGNAVTMSKEFRTQLVSKYGSPSSDKKLTSGKGAGKAQRPAYNGERQTSLGSVATWKFSPNLKEKNSVIVSCETSGPNGAAANNEEQLQLVIRYTNETLVGAAAANTTTPGKPGTTTVKKDDL